jgi:hypothetical protein
MTRHRIKTTLWRVSALLILVMMVSLAAKLVTHIPLLKGTVADVAARDVYDYLKDMSLVLVTVVAAHLTSVFQRRSRFVENLEAEWRSIVRTKSALVAYCDKQYPTSDDYLAAYARISETIDTMRIVYRNAGETATLVGLYPYAPLHDMRRVLQSLDPRLKSTVTAAERTLAQRAILQSFSGLREMFLEELDLAEPSHPLLISGGRRLKVSGHTERAGRLQKRQRELMAKQPSADVEADAFLGRLYAAERDREAAAGQASSDAKAVAAKAPSAS